ncbi:unnamed protein product [Chrysodeixis includens]|uniref:DH domain-containing protein n=1 Tax=Chrysodeixis includens TaxID=689277 RepID=A0A9N8L110_CHRIL|nr:unnamed protein product [Chrysodeixis includens]
MLPTVEETRGYDFLDPENVEKWRGVLLNPLRKVLEGIHPTLSAEETALQYVESLCLRLLSLLCAVPSPLTVQDVEERVQRTFPTPLDRWAITEAREITTTKRRKPVLPHDKLHQLLQKEVLMYKIDVSVSAYITAVLEYMSGDILRLAGNYVKKISQKSGYETITCRDIKTAMCADKVLMDMFYQESEHTSSESSTSTERRGRRGSLSYAELVRDLLADEKHFLRDLNLIIRVFKEELEKILDKDSRAISLIFGNIVDIYELTVTLLGNLEDAMEMSQDSPTPYIGSCFEELAEVEEFRAYVRYANIVTRKESRDALQNIVDDPVLSERLDTAGHGFRLAVKYYLPKLLLAPVAHVFLYHNYVLALLQIAPASEDRESFKQITPASEDRESFKQVECNLHPIKKLLIKALGNGPKIDATLRMASRARRQLAIEKCNELARIVDNWDSRDIGQCCNEFIREDTLSKLGPGKRIAERRAYLFDGLLLLCKPITSIAHIRRRTVRRLHEQENRDESALRYIAGESSRTSNNSAAYRNAEMTLRLSAGLLLVATGYRRYHDVSRALCHSSHCGDNITVWRRLPRVVSSSTAGGGGGGAQQLKLKEKLHIRKLELVDRPDTDEGRHMVELCPRVGPAVLLACASCAEKRHWMCDLVMLNTKPMLDRFLDRKGEFAAILSTIASTRCVPTRELLGRNSVRNMELIRALALEFARQLDATRRPYILLDLERRHPLKLPPASLYRFAVPDSPQNIVLEDLAAARHTGNAPVPLIKCNNASEASLGDARVVCVVCRDCGGWWGACGRAGPRPPAPPPAPPAHAPPPRDYPQEPESPEQDIDEELLQDLVCQHWEMCDHFDPLKEHAGIISVFILSRD